MRNMNDILRQAQVMQSKLSKLQQEMAERSYEAASGGGMVKAEVSGKQELRKLTIDPKALEGGDVEMLQDMVTAAVNEALRGVSDMSATRLNAATGGMSIPGLM